MLKQASSLAYPYSRAYSRAWSRVRVQLGGALLMGELLPIFMLLWLQPELANARIIQHTGFGMAAAICLSMYLLRNITIFPGIRSGYFVLPSLLIGFGVAISILLFLRLEYSRPLLLVSFSITLFWLYLVNLMSQRGRKLRIGVVPFGDVASVANVARVDWRWLTEPVFDPSSSSDGLVADFRADLPRAWETFLANCALAGLPVFHIKQFRESLTGRVEIEHLSENSFGSLVPFMAYLRLRRLLDFTAAIALGVLLLPLLVAVAIAIKVDSPGPVLFRQRRVGYRGATFEVIKFRSMAHVWVDRDVLQGAMTQDNDHRVTRFGRFLRRSRIDELPQILNILKGEMSWIGPRPEAEILSRWYESELPFYRYRHIVPPGITGWAQVNQGHVSDLEHVNFKLHYDFYYIKNFSPWLDALIVVRTIQTILTGFGYR